MINSGSIQALHRLLTEGEIDTKALDTLYAGRKYGLWTTSLDDKRAVAAPAMVGLWSNLPNEQEAVAALVACEPDERSEWLRILAARMQETGQRRDVASVCQMIETLGPACRVLRETSSTASLKPTPYRAIEQQIFGGNAEHAITTPRLLRAIGATVNLIEGGQGCLIAPLPDVDPLNPSQCWIQGRLLKLPVIDEPAPCQPSSVLSGSLADLVKEEYTKEDNTLTALMHWVVRRPWAMLLAQLVFTQEAWAAERITGGVTLELDEGQIERFHQPLRVEVVVTTSDGREIICGTLGQLMQRVLDSLGVTILAPKSKVVELDERLGLVIYELLKRKVWLFSERVTTRQRPGYIIHENFSSACYRIFGSKYFYRAGALISQAIRRACTTWAEELMSSKGTPNLPVTEVI